MGSAKARRKSAKVGMSDTCVTTPMRAERCRARVSACIRSKPLGRTSTTGGAARAWAGAGSAVAAALRNAACTVTGATIAPPQQGMPELAAAIREDPQVRTARATLITLLESLVEAAQAEGMLRADVATGDVVQLLALLKRRPVVPEELAERVGARTRALLLDALRADGRDALPGEPVRVEEFLDRT